LLGNFPAAYRLDCAGGYNLLALPGCVLPACLCLPAIWRAPAVGQGLGLSIALNLQAFEVSPALVKFFGKRQRYLKSWRAASITNPAGREACGVCQI